MYFSQIEKSAIAPDPLIGRDFFKAFTAHLSNLASHSRFTKDYPKYCDFGEAYFVDHQRLSYGLQQAIGDIAWPLEERLITNSNTKILDAVQFFYGIVAKPVERKECYGSICGAVHIKSYDVQAARDEYRAEINRMFDAFNHPYELQSDGAIKRKNSALLDSWVMNFDFKTDDDVLIQRLSAAFENFYDKSGTKKFEGLRNIVDAFERLKTLEDTDKAQSVSKVIAKISPDEKVREYYNDLFRAMTNVANRQTIRHSEKDKDFVDPKEDEDIVEFLFYAFYAAVRLILTRYGFVRKAETTANTGEGNNGS